MDTAMIVSDLMDEYNFEIDDVRWYLSSIITERVLSMKDKKEEISRFIWSGRLEKELYNMEERFLADLEDQFHRDILDEPKIREIFAEIETAKKNRA
jgi:hypothetical protein